MGDGDADSDLQSAWVVASLVVPALASPADLLALALSHPCALASACLARVARLRPRCSLAAAVADALVSACARRDGAAVARLALPPFDAAGALAGVARAAPRYPGAVPWLCAALAGPLLDAGVPGPLGQALRRAAGERERAGGAFGALVAACCAGMPAAIALLGDRRFRLARADVSEALDAAARAGSVAALDALALPPHSAGLVSPYSTALAGAARGGHVEAMRRLAQPPYSMCRAGPEELLAACAGGSVGAARALCGPPWLLRASACAEAELLGAVLQGADPSALSPLLLDPPLALQLSPAGARLVRARLPALVSAGRAAGLLRDCGRPPLALGAADARAGGLVARACRAGCVDVLDALALPPYSLAGPDARADDALALRAAAASGHADVLRRLGRPPYALGGPEARARECEALRSALAGGHLDAARALCAPPYALGPADARARANEALRGCASAAALRLLGAPPLLLGGADVRATGCEALVGACARGDSEMLGCLGAAPWCLGGADARARGCEALYAACRGGHAGVVRALGGAPWGLGAVDARAGGNRGLRWACLGRHAGVVEALAHEPYGLRQSDAREAVVGWVLFRCLTPLARRLMQAPYALSLADLGGPVDEEVPPD
eukprot:m51a1_g8533 hypothetical protein (622) ;mRNA; r:158904-160854